MNRAIFFDRDGVLNPLVLNTETNNFEAPHVPEDFTLFSYTIKCLQKLQEMGFDFFLISNQPDSVLGKATMENITKIKDKFEALMQKANVKFTDYFYCYHHPAKDPCECRKPNNFFIKQAEKKYNINLQDSWLIGDQDTDILCGKKSGLKTILINYPESGNKRKNPLNADFNTENLEEAVNLIGKLENK